MDSFLAVLIFTFPGLITYFWIQLFGITPTVRYQGSEVLAISAILWIPVNIIVLALYDILILLTKFDLYFKMNLVVILDMKSLNALASNFFFLMYYVVASGIVSYLFAKIMSGKLYDQALNKINVIRARNQKAPLSRETSVWDKTFSHDQAQIVKVSKVDNPKECVVGELQNVSRTYELEKNIVLRETEHWTEIVNAYNIRIENIFVDVRTGIKIEIYNSSECLQAQTMYNQSQEQKQK